MSVTDDAPPAFDWTPACGVGAVSVMDAHAEQLLWRVEMHGANGIAPGVRYGRTPRAARASAGPRALTQGGEYRVLTQIWVPAILGWRSVGGASFSVPASGMVASPGDAR